MLSAAIRGGDPFGLTRTSGQRPSVCVSFDVDSGMVLHAMVAFPKSLFLDHLVSTERH